MFHSRIFRHNLKSSPDLTIPRYRFLKSQHLISPLASLQANKATNNAWNVSVLKVITAIVNIIHYGVQCPFSFALGKLIKR